MERMKIGKEKFGDFLTALDKQLYAPQKVGETLRFVPVTPENKLDLEFSNTTVPPKSVLFPQVETLYQYELGKTDLNLPDGGEERVLVGVRPCDARAMAIVDNLFSWDIDDPYYLAKREKTTVIGLACSEPGMNCFCTSVGGGPASTEGLDLLLTDLGEVFLLQSLTEKGKRLCQEAEGTLEQATEEEVTSAEKLHQEAAGKIVRNIDTGGISEKLPELWDSSLWQDVSEACLGCGTCTFLCPTCHCFDIQDEAEGLEGRRCRVWDSCMFSEYTLHASGHNPRPTRRERTRNRVNHKYSYFVTKFERTACVGCGRCINLCPVNIDILNILAEVIKEAI
ncbi:MAG: 4Fe-4S dicluster domain-containing protein [Dethiobacteria bacterium]|jgi:sulfhydrogenase subunit beta (sulfur reductase)